MSRKQKMKKYSLIGEELGRQMAELRRAEDRMMQALAEAFEAAGARHKETFADGRKFNSDYKITRD